MAGRCLYPSMQDELDSTEFPEAFDNFHPDCDDIDEEIDKKGTDLASVFGFPPVDGDLRKHPPERALEPDWMQDTEDYELAEHEFEDDKMLDPVAHGFYATESRRQGRPRK